MAKFVDVEGLVFRQIKKATIRPFLNGIYGSKNSYQISSVDTTSQKVGISETLGTVVYSNLVFEEGNYEDLEGNTINYASGNIVFDTAIFTINLQKNIIKTQVFDRKGTVKEHISQGDYSISCNCKIVGKNGERADNLIREIRRILEVPQSITVTSTYLQLFGITEIVIETADISQREGSRNVIDFSFTASSDIPLEVELSNNL